MYIVIFLGEGNDQQIESTRVEKVPITSRSPGHTGNMFFTLDMEFSSDNSLPHYVVPESATVSSVSSNEPTHEDTPRKLECRLGSN